MPGLKASPGMADVNVCYGAYGKGSEGVQSALQKARWRYNHASLHKGARLDLNRYSADISPIEPGSDATAWRDSAPSPPSIHEGFENLVTPPSRPVSPLSPEPEESGLPPTPPIRSLGSSTADSQRGNVATPMRFADGVRNALRTEKSTTPLLQQASPPTPDPSPPRRLKKSATPIEPTQNGKPQLLHPPAGGEPTGSELKTTQSSRTELSRTARDDGHLSANGNVSPILLEEDTLPQHWLETRGDLRPAGLDWGELVVKDTPQVDNDGREDSRPTLNPPRSSTDAPHDANELSEREKQLIRSFQTSFKEDASIPTQPLGPADRKPRKADGLGLSGVQSGSVLQAVAQEQNNQVYKRIQEDNAKRHSSLSATISAGIAYPAPDSTPPKTLKRQTKCYSLRSDTGYDSEKNSETNRSDLVVSKRKKLLAPDTKGHLGDSPIFQSSIRQVSSPAKLGVDASDMTALTFASMQDSPTARKAPKPVAEPAHKLRHFSPQDRLTNNMSIRRTSLEASPPLDSHTFQTPIRAAPELSKPSHSSSRPFTELARSNASAVRSISQPLRVPKQRVENLPLRVPKQRTDISTPSEETSPSGKLRHFSHDARLENNGHIRRTSLDIAATSPLSSLQEGFKPPSPRKSIDARYLFPTTTPASQFSDRTDNIEIGEAKDVRFFQHNNDSLMLVQHGSRPTSKGKESAYDTTYSRQNGSVGLNDPVFAAQVEPPTPTLPVPRPAHQVDSPLTNPRTAPEPPSFKVIPPTPERELLEKEEEYIRQMERAKRPQAARKGLNFKQRARRYSDILLPGLGGQRRSNSNRRNPAEQRDRFLSPLWRPQGFWDDFDSEDEEDYDDFEAAGTLPRGGDTSNVVGEQQRKNIFPRSMSKRLPGFRGSGGFLVGNSLGIDRHGTNKRRHYVSTGSRTLGKRASEEFRQAHIPASNAGEAAVLSQQPGSRTLQPRSFVVPFTGGSRAYWVGMRRFQAKIRALRLAREERAKEKKREEIRRSIGHRFYHGQ